MCLISSPARRIAGIAVAALACLGLAQAQAPDPKLVFEVASVKPSPPYDPAVGMVVRMRGGPGTNDPGRITIENFSLPNLIRAAYALRSYQFSAPNLSETETFNISAKVPDGTTKEQSLVMLQNLLAERFKLVVHHEQKEIPVFELVVSKGGSKMTPPPSKNDDSAPPPPPPNTARLPGPPALGADGYPVLGAQQKNGMAVMNGRARMRASNESMAKFATALAGQTGRPVEDKTGLEGEYNIELYWSSEGARPNAAVDLDTGPTLMEAIQDQLGLKLQQTKGQVDILVVDHVEKTPTEN